VSAWIQEKADPPSQHGFRLWTSYGSILAMRNVEYGRVFSFASKGEQELKEDFLTEHLALAIRLDPRPFVRAFGTRVQFPKGDFKVLTQVSLPDRSRLDLVLERAGRPIAWVEIKADAGEHGNQLERYMAAAAALDPSPTLLLLGPATFWPESTLPRIVWSDLVEAVEATDEVSDAWHYVVGAIEHFELGGGKRMPLNSVEAASPQAIHVAVQRMMTYFFELAQALRAQKPARKWWDNYDVEWMLWNQLTDQTKQRLIYQFDVVDFDVNKRGDPPMMMWIGLEGGRFVMAIEARQDFHDADAEAVLGPTVMAKLSKLGWSRHPAANEIVITNDQVVGASEAELMAWALDRIADIESSGAYDRMRAECEKELIAD
jgi:hypothetical protein